MPTKTLIIFLVAMLMAAMCSPVASYAKPKKKIDEWESRENMANRFGSEWYKIEVLNRELSAVDDVLADIRDLELFPVALTGLEKKTLVRFDKRISRMEKKQDYLESRVAEFKGPLLDAMAILREMVIGEPVESMFAVLEEGDLARITEMPHIKHEIDTLWKSTDTLLTAVMVDMGVSFEETKLRSGFEEEFFAILKANLGQQSEQYYHKLSVIKNSLTKRASFDQIRDMYAIETNRIQKYLKENRVRLAQQKITDVTERYRDRVDISELSVIAARIALLQEDFEKVISICASLPDDGSNGQLKRLYRTQSLFALRRHNTLWQESGRIDYSQFSDTSRNLLVWMTMESALALGKREVYVRLASFVERKAPYAIHIMHTLGRSYLAANDPVTALSVFESAMKFQPITDLDRIALREVHHAVAETNYELGNYQKALAIFFERLNDQSNFARSLYGILWCYLAMGIDEKAEATIRKVINQAPESRYAAESFLILAQRYLSTSRNEWKKFKYLAAEERRFKEMLLRLDLQQRGDTTEGRDSLYATTKTKIEQLIDQISAKPRESYESIASGYDNVERIGELIRSHYSTGTFQTVVFTEKRAELLHYLDSCRAASKVGAAREKARVVKTSTRDDESAIRHIVNKATVFCTEAMLERSRFDQEYLDWQKTKLNAEEREALRPLLEKTDSTARLAVDKTKKKFSRRLDSLIAFEEKLQDEYNRRLTERLESLLIADLDSSSGSYFHYQLGELYYADENARYMAAYDKFEKAQALYEQKKVAYREGRILEMPEEPEMPRIDHSMSSAEFMTSLILSAPPKVAAAAHYGLAWCFNDQGNVDSALAHMRLVANDYPSSVFAPQAWMYIGEYLFDRNDLAGAVQCYQSVMNYPESEWFEEALYKLGWSQYRLSNPEKAISSFLALVSLSDGRRQDSRSLLEKEAMDYIAISFSESDLTGGKGLDRATLFARKLGNPERGSQILHRLATVYADQSRYDMARKTYKRLLQMNPSYRNIVGVESELIAIKDRDASPEETSRLRVEFYKSFNKRSAWASQQANPDNVAKADSLAEGQLYEAAIAYHQLALQKNDSAIYGTALDTYTKFIRHYPKSRKSSECHYNLAELEFSLGNYKKAAEEYLAVSKRYPDSRFRETAAWNAIVAAQNLLRQQEGEL